MARVAHREMTKYPVQYPTSCSPQAWSTGAPLLLLRTMRGLEPIGEHLVVDAALPQGIGRLELLDIPGRWGHVDAFGRGRVDLGKKPRARQQLGVLDDAQRARTRAGRKQGARRTRASPAVRVWAWRAAGRRTLPGRPCAF